MAELLPEPGEIYNDGYDDGHAAGYQEGLLAGVGRIDVVMYNLLSNWAGQTSDEEALEAIRTALGFHPPRGRHG